MEPILQTRFYQHLKTHIHICARIQWVCVVVCMYFTWNIFHYLSTKLNSIFSNIALYHIRWRSISVSVCKYRIDSTCHQDLCVFSKYCICVCVCTPPPSSKHFINNNWSYLKFTAGWTKRIFSDVDDDDGWVLGMAAVLMAAGWGVSK